MAYEVKKSEHVGAKNGGGFWGTRFDAKSESSRIRRLQGKALVRDALDEQSSPFDVTSAEAEASTDDIIAAVRESRER